MKINFVNVCLLFVCACAVSCANEATEKAVSPKAIAHKGIINKELYPENTMPAFEAACKSKFWGIEYDVRQTKDKKEVICHDDDVSKTSDGNGLVYEKTLEELQKFNFGVKKGMTEVRIPLFEEVFDLCHKNGKFQMIEIKDGASPEDVKKYWIGKFAGKGVGIRDRVPEGKEVCDVVVAKIKKAHAEKTTKIGCFTIRILLYVHNKYPDIQTHLFIGERNVNKYINQKNNKVSVKKGSDAEKCLASVKSVGVKAAYRKNKTIVKQFHDRGLSVDAWGIMSQAEYDRMKAIGVDSVTIEDESLLK